mmetsp:Transcript_10648/g.28277  ORF Transcript_10648/g.28277 Transcript_10648/m.28277 type:complete len:88 (+) Transcript_10648:1865-2128(+)
MLQDPMLQQGGEEAVPQMIDKELRRLLDQREAARQSGEYATADAIRADLYHHHRVTVDDGDGTWRRWVLDESRQPPPNSCHVWLKVR